MALKVIVITALLHAFVSGSAGQASSDRSNAIGDQAFLSSDLANNFIISPRFRQGNSNAGPAPSSVPVTVHPPGSPDLLDALNNARDNILVGTDIHAGGGLAGLISGVPVVTAAPVPDHRAPSVIPTFPVVIPSEAANVMTAELPQPQFSVPQGGRADDQFWASAFQPRRSPFQRRFGLSSFTVPPLGSPNLLEALNNVRDDIFENSDIHPVGGLAGLFGGEPTVTAATVSETNG